MSVSGGSFSALSALKTHVYVVHSACMQAPPYLTQGLLSAFVGTKSASNLLAT